MFEVAVLVDREPRPVERAREKGAIDIPVPMPGYGYAAVGVQFGFRYAAGGIDAMAAGRDAAESGECDRQADEGCSGRRGQSGGVEKNNACAATRCVRLAQQCTGNARGMPHLREHCETDMVILAAEALRAHGERSPAQVEATFEDEPDARAAGLGIDDGDRLHSARVSSFGGIVCEVSGVFDGEIGTPDKAYAAT